MAARRRFACRCAAAWTLAIALAVGGDARGASVAPELKFRTRRAGRVMVHYHQGLEDLAERALPMANEILDRHTDRYGVKVGLVRVVLTDVDDDPNGLASPLPYPFVHIRVVAPDGSDDFGNYDDWLRLVLTHELAHVVHLEPARGIVAVGRKLFGRAPYLFPNANTPGWMVEGLATFEETRGTAFGRGRNPDARMVLRMASLEGDFPREDEAVPSRDRWPGPFSPYLFGEAFVRDLDDRFGSPTLPELARVHAAKPLPAMDEWTAERVTGAPFQTRWREWRDRVAADFQAEAAAIRERGLTESTALTSRGVRQLGARFSPDGQWIAYTDRGLKRYHSIRVVRPDGTGERKVTNRNGGSGLSWTPDGRHLVYEEPEVHRLFFTRYDLRVVDVATGRVRELTRGLRAREPDVSPDGRTVVFVRHREEGSDLALLSLEGWLAGGTKMPTPRPLTQSPSGVQWGSPHWSPQGGIIVASRWSPGGHLDIVRVDPATGQAIALTDDRAKDVEPAWMPDGSHVLFRSDRGGVSNLYALRISDAALLQVTNVMGGAFMPDVSPEGKRLAFSSYGARGYDVHLTELAPERWLPAEPFRDVYPAPLPRPEPMAEGREGPYRPDVWPRFWSPYVDYSSSDSRLGAVTGGADVLLRHVWGTELHYGAGTDRFGFRGLYRYDRFRPTLAVAVQDVASLRVGTDGAVLDEGAHQRTRELELRATLPVARSYGMTQLASLAWRRRRDTVPDATVPVAGRDQGGVEASWAISTAKTYPFSISPIDGSRLRISVMRESPALGGDVSLTKLLVDGRSYLRLSGEGDTLAVRGGAGWTLGGPSQRRTFAVGGFPDASLLDGIRTNHSVLRGYDTDAFGGRRFAHLNAELRHVLARPQRGWRVLPMFVRHVHGALFTDAAHAWSGAIALSDVKTAAGASLGADIGIGYGLPITVTLGVARGLAEGGKTTAYFRSGLSF